MSAPVAAARPRSSPQKPQAATTNSTTTATTDARPISSGGSSSSSSPRQQMSSESRSSLFSPPSQPPHQAPATAPPSFSSSSFSSTSFRPQEQHNTTRPHNSFTQHHRQHNHNHHHNHNQQHQQHNMTHYKYHNDCHASVLTYEQVRRLDYVMSQTVPIHGRGNFPTLYVKLKELIRLLKHKLQTEHSIHIGDVRLNGGGAIFVLAPENSHYNDLDLIFCTDLSNQDQFDVIRDVVLECLGEFLPGGSQWSPQQQQQQANHNNQMPPPSSQQAPQANNQQPNNTTPATHLTNCALKEAYVHKMVKVNDDDRWSLISLGVQQSEQQVVTPASGNSCRLSTGYGNANASHQDSASVTTSALHTAKLDTEPSTAANQQQQPVLVPQQQQQQINNNNNNHHHHHHQAQSYQHHLQQDQPNLAAATHHQHQASSMLHNIHHHHHHNNQNQHQLYYHNNQNNNRNHKQFPNSIELKFVDRMRRKFEFSVDSFQIILDSLIQFYDYAPQSIALNGEKSLTGDVHSAFPRAEINQQASSETTDTEPRCSDVCFPFNANNKMVTDQKVAPADAVAIAWPAEAAAAAATTTDADACAVQADTDETGLTNHHQLPNDNHHRHHQTQQRLRETQIVGSYSVTKSCTRAHDDGYYHQIPVNSNDSPSASSIASSSGCSSSSSVVSSSSSSLSCDEDHEDLYCDPDSLPPSPASSSSLLDSATSSLILTSDIVSDILSGSPKLGKLSQENNENKIESKEALTYDLSNRIESLSKNKGSPSSAKYQNHRKNCNHMPWQEDCSLSTCSLNMANNETSCPVISENFYPTVICRSEYGNFKEALYHLEKKLIATRSPEEIRGGGLLKYCNLLVKNYKPTNVYQIRTLERYMCSRFFIDFSELSQQQAKLESYLANHFSDDPALKFDYLTILHNVVQRSTVCLMNHELRLTLNMIRELAYKQNEMQQHQAAVAAAAAAASATQISEVDPELLSTSHQIHLANQQVAAQTQQHQQLLSTHYYQPQKPVLIQSGVYRVKLVNYTLSKPVKP